MEFIWDVYKNKSTETESSLVVARGWGKEGWSVTVNAHEVSFWGDENDLKLDSGDGRPPLCIY